MLMMITESLKIIYMKIRLQCVKLIIQQITVYIFTKELLRNMCKRTRVTTV
jgi:hypothetical protein